MCVKRQHGTCRIEATERENVKRRCGCHRDAQRVSAPKSGNKLAPVSGRGGKGGGGLAGGERSKLIVLPADRTAEAGVACLTRISSKRGHAPKPASPLTSSERRSRRFSKLRWGGSLGERTTGGPILRQSAANTGPSYHWWGVDSLRLVKAEGEFRQPALHSAQSFSRPAAFFQRREQLPPRQSSAHRPPSIPANPLRGSHPLRHDSPAGILRKQRGWATRRPDVSARRADPGRGGHARHGDRRQGDAALDGAREGDGLLCAHHEEAATAGCSSPFLIFLPFIFLGFVFSVLAFPLNPLL